YAHLLIGAYPTTLMADARGLTAFGADKHRVRDMDGHSFLDDASLASLALGADMLFRDVQAFDDYLADLWQCPRNGPLLAPILTSNDQDGITLLNIHFGEVEGFFLFLFCCHLLPHILYGRSHGGRARGGRP